MTQRTAEGVIFATGTPTLALSFGGYPIADWAALMAFVSMGVALAFRIYQFYKENCKLK